MTGDPSTTCAVMDRARVKEWPVDGIHEDTRSLFIYPDEGADCGACEPSCSVEAMNYEDDLPQQPHLTDNGAFLSQTLPGRQIASRSRGSAAKLGALGADTLSVAALPFQSQATGA